MVSQRNRIIELEKYLVSIGIDINIGKNKARGHKGVFMHRSDYSRIDISKNLNDEDILSVLLHEFAHYIHYSYDSSLKSLDFIFDEYTDEIKEELIKVTISDVSKEFATSLYEKKQSLMSEIKDLSNEIKKRYPEFKLSENFRLIEKSFTNPLKYLLKYDRVKIFNKLYSIDNLDKDFFVDKEQKDYILLKSKQRYLKRINSRINRLNKYYNNSSELFARFVSMYYTKPEKVKRLAPGAYQQMKNSELSYFKKIESIITG